MPGKDNYCQKHDKTGQTKRNSTRLFQTRSKNDLAPEALSKLITEPPFNPDIKRDEALFLRASPEQRVIIARNLQHTYGNSCFQRFIARETDIFPLNNCTVQLEESDELEDVPQETGTEYSAAESGEAAAEEVVAEPQAPEPSSPESETQPPEPEVNVEPGSNTGQETGPANKPGAGMGTGWTNRDTGRRAGGSCWRGYPGYSGRDKPAPGKNGRRLNQGHSEASL